MTGKSQAEIILTPEQINKINTFAEKTNAVKNNFNNYMLEVDNKSFWTLGLTTTVKELDEERFDEDSHGLWNPWPPLHEDDEDCDWYFQRTRRGDALWALRRLISVSNKLLLAPPEAEVLDYILNLED